MMNLEGMRFLVVGAGFFGATIAERIAADLDVKVTVVEKRGHIGGNSASETDAETQIECHKYGTHIFHTESEKVWRYINRFSPFNTYQHKVFAAYRNKVYQMPVNLGTINSFYGKNMNPAEARAFLKKEIEKEKITNPQNLEDMAISLIGRSLYEALIKEYTRKQWGNDPRELPSSIITRLPVIYSYYSNYFDDPWQGLPIQGYYGIFNNMLSHKNITIYLNTDFFELRDKIPDNCTIIYTGPIDRFFNNKYGRLQWRTSILEKEILDVGDYQGTSVLNYCDADIPFTRIHEFRHLHRERNYADKKTVIFREYSRSITRDEEPYYPVNTREDREKFQKYSQECSRIKNVIFGGRLGSYCYLNMDKAIESALSVYEERIREG